MTQQHPLTDEMIEELAQFNPDLLTGEQVIIRDHDMRAAADWQLEQCIIWLENLDRRYTLAKHSTLAKMMREAMRPTQENNND